MPPTPFFRTTNTATLRWGRHVLVYASNCIQTYPHPLHCAVPWFMFLIAATALPPFLRAADPLWLGPCVLGSSVLGGAKRGRCNKCSSAPSCFMHPVSAPPQTFGVIEILPLVAPFAHFNITHVKINLLLRALFTRCCRYAFVCGGALWHHSLIWKFANTFCPIRETTNYYLITTKWFGRSLKNIAQTLFSFKGTVM